MTTYNPPTDTELSSEKPGKSSVFIRLRNIALAIAEGATGAPKIQTDAIEDGAITPPKIAPPTAGTTYDVLLLQNAARGNDGTTDTALMAYESGRYDAYYSDYRHISARILFAGTVTASVQHMQYTGGNPSYGSEVRVLKNGSVVGGPWFSSTAFTTRTVDISVVVGDLITFQQIATRASDGAQWQNVRIQSGTNVLCCVRA